MANLQTIEDWMAKSRHSRRMTELLGKDTDKGFNRGKCSSMTPRKSILTSSSSSDTRKVTDSELLRHYPALMDPRNFLRLITRYTGANILLWANNGRPHPIVTSRDLYQLRLKAFKLMGERTPGGVDTLRNIVDIAKSHNRLDDERHTFTRIEPEVICMNMDAWYDCISQTTTSDFTTLPLYFGHHVAARETLTLLLGNNDQQRVSLILTELMHDPLFPYRSLQDIPDHVLLEWCVSHSYFHVLDKLKVNNPCIGTTQEDIKARVETLINAPVLWTPEDRIESAYQDDTMSTSGESVDSTDRLFMDDDEMEGVATQEPDSVRDFEFFQRCGTCIDDDVSDCKAHVRATQSGVDHTGPRRPGQQCIRCESLGEPCEDRLIRERRGSLTSKTFKANYHTRQRFGGHLGERVEENKRLRYPPAHKVFVARGQLYPLLLDETSGLHGSQAKTSILCLPKKKPDEGEILALVESISGPCDMTQMATEHDALLSASTMGKQVIAKAGVNQDDEDENMEDDEGEEYEDWDDDKWNSFLTGSLKHSLR